MPGGRKKATVPKDLILQAVDGDRGAYDQIVRLCYKDVYDYIIRRVGNRSDAEVLTQTVFMKCLEAISGYEERGRSIKAWFYRIAYNLVVDHYSGQRHDINLDDIPEIVDTGRNTVEIILSKEVSEEMRDRLFRFLPPLPLEVIVLKDYKGLNYDEIGEIIGINPGNARVIRYRALRDLRRGYLLEMNEAGLSVEEISSKLKEMSATQVREELDEAIRWRLRNGYVLELHEREFSVERIAGIIGRDEAATEILLVFELHKRGFSVESIAESIGRDIEDTEMFLVMALHERRVSVKRIAEIIGRDVSDVRMLLKEALEDRSDEEEA